QRHDAQHLGMMDEWFEQTSRRRDRKLQHDFLAVGNLRQFLQEPGKQQPVAFVTIGTLDVHLRLDDRDHPVDEDLARHLELLGDEDSDAGPVRVVDYRTLLGAEYAEALGPLKQSVEPGIRLHHLDAVLFVLEALVDLDERDNALLDQRPRDRGSVHSPIHRPFEQYGADHLATTVAGRLDDPRAHLVDQVEHLLVARPFVASIAVTHKGLGRGPAALVKRGDEAAAVSDLLVHFGVWHVRHPALCSRTATPGSVRPSIHSRNAPPAVETKVKSPATPAWFRAATGSPPPATQTTPPRRGSAAAL